MKKTIIIFTILLTIHVITYAEHGYNNNFTVHLWISEEPYNCLTMGSTIQDSNRILFPNNALAGGGQNDTPWPLCDTTYIHNGGAVYSDWAVDLNPGGDNEYKDVVFYLTSKITGDVTSFCEFDVIIKWSYSYSYTNPLQFAGFVNGNLRDDMWIGSLFANDENTAFNDSLYYLDAYSLSPDDGFRIHVYPKDYNIESNVTTDSTTSDYLCKLFFDVNGPGYSNIYIDSVDIVYCDNDGELYHGFVVPNSAAYVNYLGDVTAGSYDRTTGDGRIDIADLSLWSCSYSAGITGSYVPASEYYAYKFDIGPTLNGWVNSFPQPDGYIEFEDLVIFGMMWDLDYHHYLPHPSSEKKNLSDYSITVLDIPTYINRTDIDVSIFPESDTLSVGDIFTIEVRVGEINSVDSLHTIETIVSFDPNILKVVSDSISGYIYYNVYKGPFLRSGVDPGGQTFSTFFFADIVDSMGFIYSAEAILGPWGVSGNGTTLYSEFEAIANGVSSIEFTSIYLADNHADIIPAYGINGHITVVESGVDDEPNLSNENILYQNYPNPFSPRFNRGSTTISFSLTTENTEDTEISIYNLKGQLVKHFEIRNPKPGTNKVIWNGKSGEKELANGIYFYKLSTKDKTFIKKMILMQ